MQGRDIGLEQHDLVRPVGHIAEAERQRGVDGVADRLDGAAEARRRARAERIDAGGGLRLQREADRPCGIEDEQEIPSLLAERQRRSLASHQAAIRLGTIQ